ncbi:hypothetical protein TH53_19700 [Pedobacter lusitanus]|uniref:Peptidase C51 domain-containing protein n=1 Tax=Pedobacter lusitanus TaxID=1503925 RepID=A0A0D0GM93_9SPHI|nr:CHAP domain-containing protein [Pedobacter lusitanus]KIO75566.1 hypothetical protein TH53_19700 [Pedobacter lusitanus]
MDKISDLAIKYALSQVGVREATGKNDGPAVESYLSSVGLGKGYSWCMAFVYWCFNKSAKDLSLKNPLYKTGGVLKEWEASTGRKSKVPTVGSVMILDYGKGLGHTGIVYGIDGLYVLTIEGNTNDNGSREGIGVFKKKRLISSAKGFIEF